jgi:hypothetical protein
MTRTRIIIISVLMDRDCEGSVMVSGKFSIL